MANGAGPDSGATFPGYEVLGELGRGGMGIVYRARDERRGEVVALKTLAHADSAALYRFKNEFRGFASIAHRNLVSLYDLVSDGATWFFTMEWVRGRPLLEHVRADAAPGAAPRDLARLRAAFRQLAEGVAALHDAGKVHRDVKPANVLVADEGRVVLLDFGLGTDAHNLSHDASRSRVVGTLDYMAPEQAFEREVSPSVDWYALGMILYEALTGQLPFQKVGIDALVARHQRDVPAPSSVASGVPEDLDRLAAELLRRQPGERPSGESVIRALAASAPAAAPSPVAASTGEGASLVGRERQLEALADAADAARSRTVLVLLEGRSGMGKTALAQSFLEARAQAPGAVVLAGRCYERESVPFKALDAVVDALSRHLGRLTHTEVGELLPRDPSSLVQMFPVLRRVPAVAEASARGSPVADPAESRRRATAGLREVLARIGDRSPLVIFIDDLQWGDADSGALLTQLLRPPDAPRLLLLGGHRSEDAARSPFLDAIKALLADRALDSRRIAVEPLARREAADLCLRLLGRADDSARAAAERMAEEAGGSPLFAAELARALATESALGGASREGPSFQALVAERAARLEADARGLVEAVAVAGRPVPASLAASAAGIGSAPQSLVVPLLRSRLLRTVGTGAAEMLDAYHDRVRDVMMQSMEPGQTRRLHARLAQVLADSGSSDHEALARHWEGAGEPRKAAAHYVAAADEARGAFAFEHAVTLSRRALELEAPVGPRRARLLRSAADALLALRRGTEAGSTYLEAAMHADADSELELRCLAGAEYLKCGRMDEGTDLLDDALRRVGISTPRSRRSVVLRIALLSMFVRLRGLGFRRREEADVPAAELRRIDLCYSVGCTVMAVDALLGRLYMLRHVRLALHAGEVKRVAVALVGFASLQAIGGTRNRERAQSVWRRAGALRTSAPRDDYLEAMVAWTQALIAHATGDMAAGLPHWREAERRLRGIRVGGASWELDQAMLWRLRALESCGSIETLAREVEPCLREAQEQKDLLLEAELRIRLLPVCALAADDPEAALSAVDAGIASWSRRAFFLQHLYALLNRANIAVYRGDGAAAFRAVDTAWPTARRSQLLRIELTSVFARTQYGRSALAAARGAAGRGRRRLLRLAHAMAAIAGRPGAAYAIGLAGLVRAGAFAMDDSPADAQKALLEAESAFESAQMALHLAVARRQRGVVVGGDLGRSLVAESEARIRDLGVRNPVRWSAMYAPGFEELEARG